MKILAIDSSGPVASVAVVTEDAVLAEYTVNFKKTHSQTLLPMIEEIMKMTETEGKDLSAIAVTAGPGSYTGLRIGASTVKGLGLVWQIPIVPVSTIAVLAANYAGHEGLICPILDARRGQVYGGLYRFSGITPVAEIEPCCTLLQDLISEVNRRNEKVIFLGDGVPVHKETLESSVTCEFTFAPMNKALQSAASLGLLAVGLFKEGKTVTAEEMVPEYLRQSQAEREREERLANRSHD